MTVKITVGELERLDILKDLCEFRGWTPEWSYEYWDFDTVCLIEYVFARAADKHILYSLELHNMHIELTHNEAVLLGIINV